MTQKIFLDARNRDERTEPGDDFYQHAVGGWLARHDIPDDRSEWSTFHQLRADVEKKLRAVITRMRRVEKRTPQEQMVVDFYDSGLHAQRNRLGARPLRALLDDIVAIDTEEALMRAVGQCHRNGVSVFFTPFVESDEKRTDTMALYLYQGGLTLPERTYYLDRSTAYRTVRTAYVDFFAQMGQHIPEVASPAFARSVLRVERYLARAMRSRVALRDVHKQYNKMTFAALRAATPHIAWSAYAEVCALQFPRTLIVGQPEYLRAVSDAMKQFSLTDRKRYLMWRTVTDLTPYTSEDISQTHFAFFGAVLSGAKTLRPRWKRVVQAVDTSVGEALGAMFVQKYFPPHARRHAQKMTEQIIAVCGERIRALSWMAPETKRKALAKLKMITVKIGYPDTPKTYDGLRVDAQDFFGNVVRANQWHFAEMVARIGTKADRSRWEMTAPTVNAYYHPLNNEIVFPAGILQPPFFHDQYDDAMNYGGIGTVIAHEVTHGFDDQGSLYDARGNIKDWWTTVDRRKFRALTKKVIAQFDTFEALPGLRVNGALTVGENIADLGGVMIALDAFLRTCRNPHTVGLDGKTPVQRFFLSYALTEASKMRPEELRRRIVTDPHAPGRFRVNGPVVHCDAFYDAFGITRDAPMYRLPRTRVRIW